MITQKIVKLSHSRVISLFIRIFILLSGCLPFLQNYNVIIINWGFLLFICIPLAVRYSCNLVNLELTKRFMSSILSPVIISKLYCLRKYLFRFHRKISLVKSVPQRTFLIYTLKTNCVKEAQTIWNISFIAIETRRPTCLCKHVNRFFWVKTTCNRTMYGYHRTVRMHSEFYGSLNYVIHPFVCQF